MWAIFPTLDNFLDICDLSLTKCTLFAIIIIISWVGNFTMVYWCRRYVDIPGIIFIDSFLTSCIVLKGRITQRETYEEVKGSLQLESLVHETDGDLDMSLSTISNQAEHMLLDGHSTRVRWQSVQWYFVPRYHGYGAQLTILCEATNLYDVEAIGWVKDEVKFNRVRKS